MTTTTTASVVRSARNTIALCFAVAVLEGFDIQAIGIAAPRLAPEFGLTPQQMGWLFAISNIGLMLGAGLGGWLADRLGRKPVLIGSVAVFGLLTFLTVWAPDFHTLFITRLLTGLGFGGALPNMIAIAAEVSPPQRRALTASLIFCGMPLGGGSSALLTQVLPQDFDWRVLFLIGGLLPLLVAPALWWFLPETLQRQESAKQRMGSTHALFGGGRAASTLLLWLAFLPTLLILYLILNWLPTLVVANGLDRAVAPQASLAFNFAAIPGALLFGKFVDRCGVRWPLTIAYGCLIVVLLALAVSRDLLMIVVLSGAAGFFVLGANYSLYGIAASYYPQNIRGTGSGASVAVGRFGSVIGPLLAGLLLGSGAHATTVVQYMVPVTAIAGIAVFALSFRPQVE